MFGHAPRERVSWNALLVSCDDYHIVTLHVSVWVEIYRSCWKSHGMTCHAPRERVSWNEKEKAKQKSPLSHAPRERVSWNEVFCSIWDTTKRHAPRERVSWNLIIKLKSRELFRHAPRERVSWNWGCEYLFTLVQQVTLHVSVWVEIFLLNEKWLYVLSRSTWACELKYISENTKVTISRHAPRERVSWNLQGCSEASYPLVTLHVSVWVEIPVPPCGLYPQHSHAPRERVSWNLWKISQKL